MKNFLSFALVFCLVLTTLATGFVNVFAEGNKIDEESNITWSFDAETGVLSFEGEGVIPDYNDFITDGNLTLQYPWKDLEYKIIEFLQSFVIIWRCKLIFCEYNHSVVHSRIIVINVSIKRPCNLIY